MARRNHTGEDVARTAGPSVSVAKFDFVILGAGRGGTSLIAALLDAHPDLEVAFERYAIEYLMGQALARTSDLGLNERIQRFISACNADALRSSCAAWGNKITTEQISGLNDPSGRENSSADVVLSLLFGYYLRQKKLIFILRDGRACVLSKVRRAGLSYEVACARWRYCVDCYRFLRRERRDALFLRFEELLRAPEVTLSCVCDYLGVSFQQNMLEGVANPKLRPEYRQDRVDTAKAAAADLPPEYLKLIAPELEYCGYPV
jgi:hypothetical protein